MRDHCTAIWKILVHGETGGVYCVGGRNELRNIDVVEQLCDLVDNLAGASDKGMRRKLITFVKDRPGHDQRYAIDTAHIQARLGWEPEETFETGLRKTVQWYLAHPEWVSQVRSGAYKEWIRQQYGTSAVRA